MGTNGSWIKAGGAGCAGRRGVGDNNGVLLDDDCVGEGDGDERIRGGIIRGLWRPSSSLEIGTDLM